MADLPSPPASTGAVPATLQVLRSEHAALAAVLRSVPMLLRECRAHGQTPDFGVLRAMLFYLDEFPEKRHHRFETRLLFPRLRARTTSSRELLDHLDRDHLRGAERMRELHHALTAYEVLGEPRREAFEKALNDYVEFYVAHMSAEERFILPLAEKVLTPDDWAALDQASATHRDALAGCEPETEYRALFTRIVNRVPSPIGLGPPLEDAA